MEVVSVCRRPGRHLPPEDSGEIFLRAGMGIDGDCHASRVSPRQLLLVSTGAYEYCDVPRGSLRESILIRANELRLSSGTLLRLGPNAAVRITFECEPCGRLNRVRPRLSKDVRGKRGYLARVVTSGLVEPGHRIQVVPNVFRSFPNSWRDRVIKIALTLPADSTISYAALAELAGVPKSFCRSFPRLLRSQIDPFLWQRVVPSNQLTKLSNAPAHQPWLGIAAFEDESRFHEGVITMNEEKTRNAQPLFTSEGQVKEIQAGRMSMTIGVSEKLIEETGDPLDECTFPEVPVGADSDYDTWLG